MDLLFKGAAALIAKHGLAGKLSGCSFLMKLSRIIFLELTSDTKMLRSSGQSVDNPISNQETTASTVRVHLHCRIYPTV